MTNREYVNRETKRQIEFWLVVALVVILAGVLATKAAADEPKKAPTQTTEQQLTAAKATIAEQEKTIEWLKAKAVALQEQVQSQGAFFQSVMKNQALDQQKPIEKPKEK